VVPESIDGQLNETSMETGVRPGSHDVGDGGAREAETA
jgi:hypothetical protein